ncbi:cupin domain-containing protein [Nevskia soli]|uniref:cupin domain-containing protein n=1 Tax=Nevskia soli TaxID=418856 RepID=UPI0015D95BC3|nr:cupin domain-containing protein [Nevskia soli]
MSLFHISQTDPGHGAYFEFFRTPDLSCGVYRLAVSQPDLQEPHTEDEVYYVTEGRGVIRILDEDFPVEPGSIIFVPAHAPHHFHSIAVDLVLLVVFGPAEGAGAIRELPAEP